MSVHFNLLDARRQSDDALLLSTAAARSPGSACGALAFYPVDHAGRPHRIRVSPESPSGRPMVICNHRAGYLEALTTMRSGLPARRVPHGTSRPSSPAETARTIQATVQPVAAAGDADHSLWVPRASAVTLAIVIQHWLHQQLHEKSGSIAREMTTLASGSAQVSPVMSIARTGGGLTGGGRNRPRRR